MMKMCIAKYIRLSSEDANVDGKVKAESNSVASQRKLLTGFIEKQKEFMEISCVEYVDDGYSGTNFQRPGFQRMMEDAKAGRISTIIIKDFSRFGRDHLEVGNYLEKVLPLLGVRIISVNDGFDSVNCAGMTGGMSVALKNMLNAMYSKDLSKKVVTAMKTHARNGEYVAAFPKYGYRKNPEDTHCLMIDEDAAEIVRLVFTMAADGVPKSQIARHLNDQKVLTCTEHMRSRGTKVNNFHEKKKKMWTTTTIGDMLKNEVYLGKTIWNKSRVVNTGSNKVVKNDPSEWIVVENTHEAIITEELFAMANERAFTHKKVSRKKLSKPNPLFMCPYCGRRMGLTSWGNKYRCMQAHLSGIPECYENKMMKDELEETVLICARKMANFISADLEKKKKKWMETGLLEEKIKTFESEKARLSSRKMKLYSDYRSNQLSKEQYMEEIENIASRVAEIEERIPKMEEEIRAAKEQMAKASDTQTELNDIAVLKTFEKETLKKVIDKVFVYAGGKIEIVWNMNDIFHDSDDGDLMEATVTKVE